MKYIRVLLLVSLLLLATAASAQTDAPQRIQFATGATQAQVTGQISGTESDQYVLYAFSGQVLQITLDSGALTVVSPSGQPLLRGTAVAQPVPYFSQTLTESGDYQLIVSAPPDAGTISYTMTINISGESERTTTSERIRFQPGTTGTTVTGQISGASENSYVLNAFAGQTMQTSVDNAYLTVVSPSGEPLARADTGAQNISRALPESGDYTIRVALPAGSPAVNYTLTINITGTPGEITSGERIRFATGTTSTQLTGQLAEGGVDSYILEAFEGQTMQLTVQNAYLTLISPSGEPLARAQTGAQSVNRTLPESGDYIIQISTPAGTGAVSYTLNVTITGTPSRTDSSERIRFQVGTTGAQVAGRLTGGQRDSYLLHAIAGQAMQITINNGSLTVVSPSGQPLVRGEASASFVQSFSQTLPETGDYQVYVSLPADFDTVDYVLSVSITP